MWRTGRKFAGGVLVGAVGVLALAAPASASAATISIDDPSATEGDVGASSANFTVSLSETSTETVTVDLATSDATALGLIDYTPHSETVSFAPGETSKQVAVQVNGDLIDEPDETFTGNLSNPSVNASVADSQGTATILDDDGVPEISIDDVSHTEGNSGEKDFDFTVSLSNPSDQQITVDYDTADDSATIADGDYDSASGTLTFAAGDTSKTVTVKVNGDTTDEPDETFDVDLSENSTNSSIVDGTGAGTIQDDDGDPGVSIDDHSEVEGNSGGKDFVFTVSLSHPSSASVSVDYATADGSATAADNDYDPVSGVVTFAPGDVSEAVAVTVNGDAADEAHETFHVNLANGPSSNSIADGQGVGTIRNDDAAPTAGACPPAASDPQEGSVGALGHFRIAQTFTSQITGVATSAHAKIEKRAGAGGDWVLSVVSTDASGAPTDEVLGSVTVSDSTVPAGVGTIGGILDAPVALTAGEKYALVITRPGATEVRARIRVGDVCGGEIFRSLDQTGPFAAISSFPSIPPGLDIVFAVCGSTGPCFPPAEVSPAPGPQPGPAPAIELQPSLTVTLDADRSKIRQGKRVTLSGRVGAAGDPSCTSAQTVRLQRRRPDEPTFTTFAQVQSDPQGSFSLKQKPKKTSEYRAEVLATAACAAGLSDTEMVKVRKRK
jgi:hypothetical protein